ncbi:MAG: flagellar basal-body rod protein FlgF [Rhodocyclaceae bacterium]
MLDSIYVGMTGLVGFSKGLKVIANDTANMNTPGFKSSQLQFGDLFFGGSGQNGLAQDSSNNIGYGLNTYSTTLNFSQGELRQTGNDLDLAIDGTGMFIVKTEDGRQLYSRAGQFKLNDDGVLVDKTDGSKVMGIDANGAMGEISIAGMRSSPGHASETVKFIGNLSSTVTDTTISNIIVYDNVGAQHTLSLVLKNTGATKSGSWSATLKDGDTEIGTGEIVFADGKPQADAATLSFTYTPTDGTPVELKFDFSTDVTSYAAGNQSTLAFNSQDGYGAGQLTTVAFDGNGNLKLTYSNGQTQSGSRLALASFDSADSVQQVGNNKFAQVSTKGWHFGLAGDNGFGTIQGGRVEISNVDLSQEFSDLVVMQRGYQASSQVVSTANEMLQELFNMKGK